MRLYRAYIHTAGQELLLAAMSTGTFKPPNTPAGLKAANTAAGASCAEGLKRRVLFPSSPPEPGHLLFSGTRYTRGDANIGNRGIARVLSLVSLALLPKRRDQGAQGEGLQCIGVAILLQTCTEAYFKNHQSDTKKT